jgi:hypothetical protein
MNEIQIQQTIENFENTYRALKATNPNKDEHWYLANAFLEFYKDNPELKEKGPTVMRFIAFKESHLFSILDPPKSARAFAIFLVGKFNERLGKYVDEFQRLTAPVLKSQQEGAFFKFYKQKNPKTFMEAQNKEGTESSGPFSLYYLIQGIEAASKEVANHSIEEAHKRIFGDLGGNEIHVSEKINKNYPLAFIMAYLVPGWGHFYLGKKILGCFLFFAVVSVYGIGVFLGGGILWEEMNVLTVLAYIVKFFNGVPFLSIFFYQLFRDSVLYFNDIGTTFILVSGSLNVLIMIHLLDVIKEIKAKS